MVTLALAKVAVSIAAPLLLGAGPLLPSREAQSAGVSIPKAITSFHPLPQEELMTSYSLANSYLMEGKFEDSLAALELAGEINNELPDIWLTRGIVNEKLLNWEDALKDYQRARELTRKRSVFNREDPTIISNIANAETGLGRWDDALRDFSKSSEMDKSFYAPKIGKSLVLYQLDKKSEGLKVMKEILDLYPSTFTDGMAAVACMSFDVDGSASNLERSKVMYDEALKQDPRYSDMDWLLNIRRWPPKVVSAMESLRLAGRYEDV
jgi:tetratricopeptide (TPR) repeat protein